MPPLKHMWHNKEQLNMYFFTQRTPHLPLAAPLLLCHVCQGTRTPVKSEVPFSMSEKAEHQSS